MGLTPIDPVQLADGSIRDESQPAWFDVPEATRMIKAAQAPFLDRLQLALKQG